MIMKMHRAAARVAVAAAAAATWAASAQPVTPPVYTRTFSDAVTGDNSFVFGGFRYYTVDAGADSYQNDVYERPTAQNYEVIADRYAAEEYHGYVDIVEARLGFDDRYLYASIEVFDLNKSTKDGVNSGVGLQARYGLRFGPDPDGRNSILLSGVQPESASPPNTVFTNLKTEGWRDTDRDVGGRGGPIHGEAGPSGLAVTRTDNPAEEYGLNGYDENFITTDGRLLNGGLLVLWQRVSPASNTTVEIAFDYVAAGLVRADIESIQYLHFEAVAGDPNDPHSSLWNDKYYAADAGSPNRGVGGSSEFGTQGLGGIYMADTLAARIGGCAADFNGDGFVNGDDFDQFVAAFTNGDAAADFNGDGFVSGDDFDALVFAFEQGC